MVSLTLNAEEALRQVAKAAEDRADSLVWQTKIIHGLRAGEMKMAMETSINLGPDEVLSVRVEEEGRLLHLALTKTGVSGTQCARRRLDLSEGVRYRSARRVFGRVWDRGWEQLAKPKEEVRV